VRHVRIDPREGPSEEDARWAKGTCVRDLMSRPVITVAGGAPLGEALRLMAMHRIHYLPVIDDRADLVGLVNQDDVLGTRRDGRPPRDAVASVMSTPAVSVDPATPLREAMQVMVDRSIGALPVVEDERVVGILTQSDIVAALARQDRRVIEAHR
jgi:CBS domain-containing protein